MSNKVLTGLWIFTALVAVALMAATVQLVWLTPGSSEAAVSLEPTRLPLIPTAAAAPAPTTVYHDDPLFGQTVYLMGTGRVKLYKEASEYLGLWSLEIGTAATVLDRNPERPWWYQVESGEYTGWIERENMAMDPSGTSLPEEEVKVGYLVFLRGEEIPMYQEPNPASAVVTTFRPGLFPLTRIEALDDSLETPWYAIEINGNYGWISAEYTSSNPP